jgi:hypothetical protein
MIFTPDALLRLVAQHAAAQRIPMPVDRAVMVDVVAEAAQFAAGNPDDEPAALYYACTLRARLFGHIGTAFFDDLLVAQAAAVGLRLDASALDVVLLRMKIATHAVGRQDVRDIVAGWLRPSGVAPRPQPPAKRPRHRRR